MRTPELSIVRVPRTEMRIAGPFEEKLAPLLRTLQIELPPADHVLVPALTQQLPAIQRRFPRATPMYTGGIAQAQASTRTVTLLPELNFPFHLKLSLACTITSALRTITPWTTAAGPPVSALLAALLPPDLWVMREDASATGAQAAFDDAKHFSCILRDDLQARAQEAGEVLIIATGLAQPSVRDARSNAERVFGLDTVQKRKGWFRE